MERKIGEAGREGNSFLRGGSRPCSKGWSRGREGAILFCLPWQLTFVLSVISSFEGVGPPGPLPSVDPPLLPRANVRCFLVNLCQLCLFLRMAYCL